MFRPRNMSDGSIGRLRFCIAVIFFVYVVCGQEAQPPPTTTTVETSPPTTEDPFKNCTLTDNYTTLETIFLGCGSAPLIGGEFVFDISKEENDTRIKEFFEKFSQTIAVDFRLENNNNLKSLKFSTVTFQNQVTIVNNEGLTKLEGTANITGTLIVRGNRHLTNDSIKQIKTWATNTSDIQEFGECAQSPLKPRNFDNCQYIYGDLDLTNFSQKEAKKFHPKTISGCLRLIRESGEDFDIIDFLKEFLKGENQTADCMKSNVIEGFCVKRIDQNKIKNVISNGNIVFNNRKGCEYNCTEEDHREGQTDCIMERMDVKIQNQSDIDEFFSKIAAKNKEKESRKAVYCTVAHKDCDILTGTLLINRLNNITNKDFQNIHTIYGKILIYGSYESSIHFKSLKRIIGRPPLIRVFKNKNIGELMFPVLQELKPHSESQQTIVSIADNVTLSIGLITKFDSLSKGKFTIDGMTVSQFIAYRSPDPPKAEYYWWIVIWGFIFFFSLASFELLKLWYLFQLEKLKTEDVVRATVMQEFTMEAKLNAHGRRHHYLGKKTGIRWGGIVEWSPKMHKYKQSPRPTSCWIQKMESKRMPPAWRHLSNYFSNNYRDIEIPPRHHTIIDKAFYKRVTEKAQSIYGVSAGLGYGIEHNYVMETKKMIKDLKDRTAAENEPDLTTKVDPKVYERLYFTEEKNDVEGLDTETWLMYLEKKAEEKAEEEKKKAEEEKKKAEEAKKKDDEEKKNGGAEKKNKDKK